MVSSQQLEVVSDSDGDNYVPPSSISKRRRIEVVTAEVDDVLPAENTEVVPRSSILKKLHKVSDEEIIAGMRQLISEIVLWKPSEIRLISDGDDSIQQREQLQESWVQLGTSTKISSFLKNLFYYNLAAFYQEESRHHSDLTKADFLKSLDFLRQVDLAEVSRRLGGGVRLHQLVKAGSVATLLLPSTFSVNNLARLKEQEWEVLKAEVAQDNILNISAIAPSGTVKQLLSIVQ
ncbi:hypothetical protein BX666DRAFT_1879681 [Dichotomocladium elegans]|nr:hypothetical protein BX666DRAFT_1879681 [Dichotomocladium elegans]